MLVPRSEKALSFSNALDVADRFVPSCRARTPFLASIPSFEQSRSALLLYSVAHVVRADGGGAGEAAGRARDGGGGGGGDGQGEEGWGGEGGDTAREGVRHPHPQAQTRHEALLPHRYRLPRPVDPSVSASFISVSFRLIVRWA